MDDRPEEVQQEEAPQAEVDLDFDALLAAKKEQTGKGKKVKLGGVVYHLPSKVPAFAAIAARKGQADRFLELLLGKEQFAKLEESNLDPEQLTEFINALRPLYGIGLGES